MTSYINVGVFADNERIKTKGLLKAMVKVSPELLRFDQTSAFPAKEFPAIIELTMLKNGYKLSVVGPDPYKSRNWYATVEKTERGFKVS